MMLVPATEHRAVYKLTLIIGVVKKASESLQEQARYPIDMLAYLI